MAIVIGTNSGFVTAAPTGDPGAPGATFDNQANSTNDTSPSGTNIITEVGFYTETDVAALNWSVGLYANSAGAPTTRLFTQTGVMSTGVGWKAITGLNWSLSASTNYWIGVWVEATTPDTIGQQSTSGGTGFTFLASQTSLPDPYGTPTGTDSDGKMAIYAVYAAPSGPTNMTSFDGNLKANIKSFDGNLIANIKSISGNA